MNTINRLDDGRVLSELNTIIGYLAEDSELIPIDGYCKSQCMFFEQHSHELYIAIARFIQLYLGSPDDRLAEYHSLHVKGHKGGLHQLTNLLTLYPKLKLISF